MKLYTRDNNELMKINSIQREGDVLLVRGVIMESMPTKAVLTPEELRAAFKLLSARLVWDCLCLLFKSGK